MSQEVREHVLELMKQKEKIEDEIKHLTEILTLNGVGMNDPLVDADDFPINAIDVYQVRHARHRIICLQNDHKAIMKQIENGLQGYYSNTNNQTNGIQDVEMKNDIATPLVVYETPFAVITLVSPGSPAEFAGLCPNDLVVEFGSVNYTNFKNITDIAAVVQHSENAEVRVKIKRADRFVVVPLTPRKWVGRGLLGCNIEILK